MPTESDREIVPGQWGACFCGGTVYHPDSGNWSCQFTQANPAMSSRILLGQRCHCPRYDCGDLCGLGGHVRPNLRRVAEDELKDALETLRTFERLGVYTTTEQADYFRAADIVRFLQSILASGCLRCKGTGYIYQAGIPDFGGDEEKAAVTHYQVPCPACQPDGKEGEEDVSDTGPSMDTG